MPSHSTLSRWYTFAAAVALLILAGWNATWPTLIVSAVGVAAGLLLVAQGALPRGGVFAFLGFVCAGALALFRLLR